MFDPDRYQEKLSDFKKAFARFQDGLARAVDDLDRDGVIQRFEFTYELSWKVMKEWLASKEIKALNPKDVIREAVDQELIADGNLWSDLQDSRNLTSHTYNEKTAAEVFATIQSIVVPAFAALIANLEKRAP
jgi:nucleotidyltransferase substrate binding protein (TIGR01987 family)